MKITGRWRKHLEQARQEQILKDEGRALRHARGEWVYLRAVGQKNLDALLARGWELVTQDPSEQGAWVKQYMVRMKLAKLAMLHRLASAS